MIRSLADIYSVPKALRHDLNQYNLKHHRYMRGDIRRKSRRKELTDPNKSDDKEKGRKISIPTVQPM